jgi:tryptophan synthase beta chain
VAQAYYNKQAGTKRLATETGAGQWGSSLSLACQLFGLECMVYMVRVSFNAKPYRRLMMQTWGANVIASPSDTTEFGRKMLGEDPNCPGSLGIAISEALEDTVKHPGTTKYALGSVMNHVCLHQSVIGQETIKQMELAGEEPDVVIGCVGGGSNFAGIAFPYIEQKITKKKTRIVAVEPTSCASMTKGELRYDFGDTAGMTPLMKMHTLGHTFIPDAIHAGGLRYHGMAPLVSHIYELGLVEAISIPQVECFTAALQFARTEGIVPAPEPTQPERAPRSATPSVRPPRPVSSCSPRSRSAANSRSAGRPGAKPRPRPSSGSRSWSPSRPGSRPPTTRPRSPRARWSAPEGQPG